MERIGTSETGRMVVNVSHGAATGCVHVGPGMDPWSAASQAARMLLTHLHAPEPPMDSDLRRFCKPAALMTVRPLAEADLGDVLEITNHYILHTAINFHTDPLTLDDLKREWEGTRDRYPWFIAVDGDAVVGYAKASQWKSRRAYDPTAEVTVYVHPDHHRRGIGRELYEALFAGLRARGVVTLLAGITLPNDASVGLHESLGFRKTAHFARIGRKFDRWHDVGYWIRHLEEDFSAAPD